MISADGEFFRIIEKGWRDALQLLSAAVVKKTG
jgi:hypothetical protein